MMREFAAKVAARRASEGGPRVHEREISVPAGIRDARSYSPELESLRGVACLLVFFFHAGGLASPGPHEHVNAARAFVNAGHTGVTLFFVLSAFFLSRPFLEQALGGPRVSWGLFWKRRALRILPLYYFAVAFAAIRLAEKPADLLHGLPYLLFLDSFIGLEHQLKPFADVWWSLGTEWQFYLVLPFASLCLLSRRGRVLGATLLALYLVAYTLFAQQRIGPSDLEAKLRFSWSLFGRAPALLAGVAAAWVMLRWAQPIRAALHRPAWLQRGGADLLLLGVLWALGRLLAQASQRGFFSAEVTWHQWHVAEALAWTLVVLWVLLAPLRIGPVFRSRILRWFGVLSYSLYLVHVPILYRIMIPWLDIMRAGPPGWTLRAYVCTAVGLVSSVAVSMVTYRFVEKPFLVRKARVGVA